MVGETRKLGKNITVILKHCHNIKNLERKGRMI